MSRRRRRPLQLIILLATLSLTFTLTNAISHAQTKANPDSDACGKDEFRCAPADIPQAKNSSSYLFHLSRPGSLFSNVCIPNRWKCDGEFDCPKRDDEIGCEKVTCQPGQKQCASFIGHLPTCIPESWICDGQSDCVDMSDEANCTLSTMKCDNNSEFRCKDNKKCIFKNWVCDGDYDCDDGSDEDDCKRDQTCTPEDHFICKTVSFCVPKEWQCDGEADCADKSDELDCGPIKTNRTVTCHPEEFKCQNGVQCISQRWVCDGDVDCVDSSDEKNCDHKCSSSERKCNNGVCLDANKFCDGLDDCTDGSDEENCPTKPAPKITSFVCDPATEYTCNLTTPTRCIKFDQLCINNSSSNDCPRSVCDKNIENCDTSNGACKCRNTFKNGRVCNCQPGYELVNKQCQDIDECAQLGACDQICINTVGSYKCDCHPGYVLYAASDTHMPTKCRASGNDPLLLLANRAAIRRYDISNNHYRPLVDKLESAVAMDYWHDKNTIVWSDVSKEKIMICDLGNTTFLGNKHVDDCLQRENTTLVGDNIVTPDGLAVDWVHGLLFWTDTGLDQISVIDLVTRQRRVIIDKDLDEPRAIAVDPSAGLIFWTDWGNKARIERAGMDGKNRQNILSGSTVRWPNGLAVDILERRIYWADAKVKMISSSDYYGKNIRTILHSHQHLRHPFSLTVFEERLYWTDWDQDSVLAVNKFRGDDVKTVVHGIAGPMTVRVYHRQAQPSHPNKCKNHPCSHMCLPRSHLDDDNQPELPYMCACPLGFVTNPDDDNSCVTAAAIDSLVGPKGSAFTMTLMVFALVFAGVGIAAYIYKGKKFKQFSQVQFDNPVYIRTVEDPDSVDFSCALPSTTAPPV